MVFLPKKNCISGTRSADLTELEAPFDKVAKVQEYVMEHLPVHSQINCMREFAFFVCFACMHHHVRS